MCVYIYIYTCTYVYIYIYIHRNPSEGSGERPPDTSSVKAAGRVKRMTDATGHGWLDGEKGSVMDGWTEAAHTAHPNRHIHTYIYIYIYIYIHMHICVYIYIHVYTRMCYIFYCMCKQEGPGGAWGKAPEAGCWLGYYHY